MSARTNHSESVQPTTVKETPQQAAERQALVLLAQLGGTLASEEDIKFLGTQYVLPETQDLRGAIKFLVQKADEDEEVMSFNRTYKYRPLDGARATSNAIKRAFGFSIAKPIFTMFGKQPPQLRDIPIGPNGQTEQVPWGKLAIPGLDGAEVYVGATRDDEYGIIFQLVIQSPRKWRHHIQGFFKLVQDELDTNSIYRGQAIDGQEEPQFISLDGVNRNNVVYHQDTMQQLEANVWSPIIHREALAKLGQPGKRAVLFEGPYGTGKTLGAYLTAQTAVENGWTFIMCRPGRDDLDKVMQTARIYQPSVVFFEDLDTISQNTGDDHISRLLDTFDGISSKGTNILMVLTTNHVERIHKGMVRPGRLDAVIHVGAMDRAGVEKLARTVLGDALEKDIDFDAFFAATEGFMPAFVKEALDRAIRYSVSANNGKVGKIDTTALVGSANGLRNQLELMNGAHEAADRPTIDRLIAQAVTNTLESTKIVHNEVDGIEAAFLMEPYTLNDTRA